MVAREEYFEDGPCPDNPGWRQWNIKDDTIFNGVVMGHLITRVDDDGKSRLRMFPDRKHQNLQGIIHGAVTLALIDISMFTTMHMIGSGDAGPSVTLELSTQFVGGGDPGKPLDAVNEIVRETGKLMFIRGQVVQADDVVASHSGIVRKMKPRPSEATQ
ncbi:PaaI family thioesterase [uncultured Erythrobacter sp.]|uniref:PaaI family thioesterase n=1 Tax=uncultured Erythrobacter sp. TaxID=263913 RepID=UPI00261B2FEC|nr:PaaI family thioesterase [uncultured Erythrobacter sp.]